MENVKSYLTTLIDLQEARVVLSRGRAKDTLAHIVSLEEKLRVSGLMYSTLQTQVLSFSNEYSEKLRVAVEALEFVENYDCDGFAENFIFAMRHASDALEKIKAK